MMEWSDETLAGLCIAMIAASGAVLLLALVFVSVAEAELAGLRLMGVAIGALMHGVTQELPRSPPTLPFRIR
jgi:hypothetical protein